MRRVVLAAILLALGCTGALAQGPLNPPAPSQQTPGAIAGTVVDAVTGQPLNGAQVFLRGMGGRSGEPASTRSNAEGQFVLVGVSPGRYMISATHNDYVSQRGFGNGSRRRLLTITASQRIDGFIIRLAPGATISGRVTNSLGRPVAKVSVRAMRRSYSNGMRELSNVANVETNAAGEYRIPELPRGDYYLRATYLHPPPLKADSDQSYVPLYYPGTSEFSRSATLTTREGEELSGIDIRIGPVHTVRVKGRAVNALNPQPTKGCQVTLTVVEGELTFSASPSNTGPSGAFEFRGVPPGSYVLSAEQPPEKLPGKTLRGRTVVEIGDRDVEDIEAVVGPGMDIGGRVHVEGSASVELNHLVVQLSPRDSSVGGSTDPSQLDASVKSDGSFLFSEIAEGNYGVNVFPIPSGYYVKANPANLLEAGITVGRGLSAALDFTLSPGLAVVEGTVTQGSEARSGIPVVLVPDGARRSYPRYYRQAVTDQSGRFALRAVPPGDYKLFAANDIGIAYFMNSDPSTSYEDQGKAVHLEEGAHAEIQLEEVAND
ncbi:MAG: carboxypeptidase-like regulatory domain-containing protein [Candidatus Sulfotelmatobacter sp.]